MSIVRESVDDLPGDVVGGGRDQEWEPTDPDPDLGGPDSANPLLTETGECAIFPEWPEPRGFGPAGGGGAVVASDGGSLRHARVVHERIGRAAAGFGVFPRRVILSWSSAYGSDVELLRRAFVVTRGGAGRTRFRHPMLDAAGDVASAPWIRLVPGSWRVERDAPSGGAQSRMSVEYEYV